MDEFDLAIIGGGPAGLNAALYCSRYGLKTILIAENFGGTINEATRVENILGIDSIKGQEFSNRCIEQIKKFGTVIKQDKVDDIIKNENIFKIHLENSDRVLLSKRILIATGVKKKKLNLEDEEKYLSNGVHYCATCDGLFYKEKTVAIIGAGDAALTTALFMADLAKKVYIIYRKTKHESRAEKAWVLEVNKNEKIFWLENTKINKLMGENGLDSIEIIKENEIKTIALDALFIEIGVTVETSLAKKIGCKIDEFGFIDVDGEQKTSIKGIYAAGDVTNNSNRFMQVACAVGEGAVAANSIHRDLKKNASLETV